VAASSSSSRQPQADHAWRLAYKAWVGALLLGVVIGLAGYAQQFEAA